MKNLLYLHDIQFSIPESAVAANLTNIDLVDELESYLSTNNSTTTISLDDGYQSAQNIVSVIEKHNVKCILFITTGFIDGTIYPYELYISNFLEKFQELINLENKPVRCPDHNSKNQVFQDLHQYFKFKTRTTREALLRQFFKINNQTLTNFQDSRFLSWDGIKELSRHPLIEIGSHTQSHLYLPSQSIKTIYKELKISKESLEQALSKPINKVSYPYGGYDFRTLLIAKLVGYKQGYITDCKPKLRTPLNIPRNKLHLHDSGVTYV